MSSFDDERIRLELEKSPPNRVLCIRQKGEGVQEKKIIQ